MGGKALRSPHAAATAAAATEAAGSHGKAKSKKAAIPKALREQVWLSYGGAEFDKKCAVQWCHNRITAFTFHVGHVVAESRGGPTVLENLLPLCPSCNLSMGTKSIDEWSHSVVRGKRGDGHAHAAAASRPLGSVIPAGGGGAAAGAQVGVSTEDACCLGCPWKRVQ
jgi:hypothetical protein